MGNLKQHSKFETKTMMLKITTAALFGLTIADYDSIQSQIMSRVRNSSLRAFSGNVATAVRQFDEYGCWCYFYDNVGRGKGTPVDEIDGLCKTLHDGYMCAMIDAENEGSEECVPWEVEYNPGQGTGSDRFADCLAQNPGASNCVVRSCSVEGIFADNIFALLLGGSSADLATYSHANGFDPSHSYEECTTDADGNETCEWVQGACASKPYTQKASGDKACCGAYPNRYPFRTLDGDRACCGSRTYNTQILNCCANGQVKANC